MANQVQTASLRRDSRELVLQVAHPLFLTVGFVKRSPFLSSRMYVLYFIQMLLTILSLLWK